MILKNYGRYFNADIICVGKMIKSEKDTFKSVYKDDGNYCYPIISEKHIYNKGELYFKSYNMTESYDGKEKNPNMFLLSVYWKDIIPGIEEKHDTISERGLFKVVAVNQ